MKYFSKVVCTVVSLLWLHGCGGGANNGPVGAAASNGSVGAAVSNGPVGAAVNNGPVGAAASIGAVTPISDVTVRPTLSNGPLFTLNLQPQSPRRGDTVQVTVENVVVKSAENLVATYQWFVNGTSLGGRSDTLSLDFPVVGDNIAVLVSLSDGSDVVEQGIEFQVAEALSDVSVSGVQDTFYVGTEYVFYVEFINKFLQSPVGTQLVSGPPGLVVEQSGLVTYKPSVLLSSNETYNAVFQSADEQIFELTLNVVDRNHKPVLARSGLGVPERHNSLYVNDFDGDGKTEIFTTDNRKKLYTIEQKNGVRSIDWMYPYSASGDIVYFTPHTGGLGDFVIVTGTGVHVVPSRDAAPLTEYESTSTVVGATIGDFDQDGSIEVALLTEDRKIEILDSQTWAVTHTVSTSRRDRPVLEITHGNVDNDAALEIITGNGEVIDGSDGTLQWLHTDAFGAGITTGDLDGDGISEFIAGDRYRNLTMYNVLTQTAVQIQSEDDLDDTCSPLLLNVDSDADLELVTGGCQVADVTFWDIENDSLQLIDELVSEARGSSLYLSSGDIDQDGYNEIIWSSGKETTLRDLLVVATTARLSDNSLPVATSGHIPTLFGFSLAGETSIAGERSVAFTVDRADTSEFSSGHQLAGSMGSTGQFRFGDPIGREVHGLSPGFIHDVNLDGSDDLVHIDDSRYLKFTDMNTLEPFEIYKSFGDGNPFLDTVRQVKFSDNRTVALLSNSRNVVELYDLQYHVAVDTILVDSLDSVTALAVNNTDYLVTAGSMITLRERGDVDTGFRTVQSIERRCSELEAISRHDELFILCIVNGGRVSIEVFDAELQQVALKSLDSTVTAIEVVHGAEGDDILIGTRDGHVYLFDGVLSNQIWQSPRLTGPVTGIHYRENADRGSLSISTTHAVYLSLD